MAADLPTTGRLLCIDPGSKRIGLALSDPTQTLAQPLTTLTRRAGRRFPLAALRPLLEQHGPVGLVIGLPLESDGREGSAAAAVRATASLIAAKTGLPLAYVDERMTTALARRAFEDAPRRDRPSPASVDRMAATVMLQAFLDRRLQ
ncbi:MAG TPA: Holliday junction resolvase RuvX [Gemmatimonadales bacterium]